MGRTVVAEEAIKSGTTGAETPRKLQTGLLVGQVSWCYTVSAWWESVKSYRQRKGRI